MNWNYEQLPPSDLKEVEVLFENGSTSIAYPVWRNFDIIEEKMVETESPVFASWMLKESEDSPIAAWREKEVAKIETIPYGLNIPLESVKRKMNSFLERAGASFKIK